MDPLHARQLFKWRTPISIGIVLAIFMPSAFAIAPLPFAFAFDAALIAVLAYLHFFVLGKWSPSFNCPHCKCLISSSTPWICGFCHTRNNDTEDFPIVGKCSRCGVEPKAYKCHHEEKCGKLIFLGLDSQEKGYAWCATDDASAQQQETENLRYVEKRSMQHEIEIAELEERVEMTKQRRDQAKRKDPVEALREEFALRFATHLGAEEYAREMKKEINERFKNDAYMRKRAHKILEVLLKDRIN